jgi:RNA polymerase sigma-70 factor (ECF subfamily)
MARFRERAHDKASGSVRDGNQRFTLIKRIQVMSATPMTAVAAIATVDDRCDRIAVLFDAHQHALYRLARRLASDADAAGDLVHDTFLRAARNLGRVPDGLAAEEAWLVRVLINIRRDQWRREQTERQATTLLHDTQSASSGSHEPAVVARATVWRALDRLHPRRRAVVVLHEIDGLSVTAVAALLGIAAVTVRWHMAQARRELRHILGKRPENRP